MFHSPCFSSPIFSSSRKYLFDAIATAESPAAVQKMIKLILANEVTPFQVKTWINTLTMIRHPTLEMIHSAIVSGIYLLPYILH